MRMEIPENRTKSFWDAEMPDKNEKAQRIIYWKSLRNTFLMSLCFPFIEIIWGPRFPIFILWGVFCLFFAVTLTACYVNSLKKIKKDKEGGFLSYETIILRDIESTWGQQGIDWEPELHPINKLFPDDITVFEFKIKYKKPNQNKSWFPSLKVYCIGTPEKRKLIEKLIHMKEGVALRHESRRFKVTYKKYSKELIRIDLCEDEEYPAHCHYEELVEKINIMF